MFRNRKCLVAVFFIFAMSVMPSAASARENVTDWYIKDFGSRIVVNTDSSLDITETIVADCGGAAGKHGIFRILPTRLDIEGKRVETPVTLKGITDEKGVRYPYQEIKNGSNGTVTWKIGDADKTVTGVHTYVISYMVRNAIRFGSEDFDELYWNLNGNFWDLETDRFHTSIEFPAEVNEKNAKIDYYTGPFGSKDRSAATYRWTAPSVLGFASTRTLGLREGITASVTFPKNIFTPYIPGFWEANGKYFFLLIPLSVFLGCWSFWRKYGDDPDIRKAITPEYEAPEGFPPLLMQSLTKKGALGNSSITAEILFLATRGVLTIREVESGIPLFAIRDYELVRAGNAEAEAALRPFETLLLAKLFRESDTVCVSLLRNSFYRDIPDISKEAYDELVALGLIGTEGLAMQPKFFTAGLPFLFLGFILMGYLGPFQGGMIMIAGCIIIVFGFLMSRWTRQGAELVWRIKGFRLFLEAVDKDRAAYYEKENLFEKGLPYAILFGMTKEWIKRMREIYGEEYFATYAPIWYSGGLTNFDADSFTGAMNDLSSSIAASTSSPSGSGGSGGSGGGGGGGGGGGW